MPRPLFNRRGAPLTSRAFYVLLSLNAEDRDARAILDDVAMSSAGRVQITPATLSSNLRRLIGGGLVVQQGLRYALTHEGRLQLADELERMERAVRLARSKRTRR
jgi:predicted transcriptional regulator